MLRWQTSNKLEMVKSVRLVRALPNCAEIWQAGALWVGLVIKAENRWRDGAVEWQCSVNCHFF